MAKGKPSQTSKRTSTPKPVSGQSRKDTFGRTITKPPSGDKK